MSLSVNHLSERLYFAAIPLTLVLTGGIALWFGAIHSKSQFQNSSLQLPGFNYQETQPDPDTQPADSKPATKRISLESNEPQRNIFGTSTVAVAVAVDEKEEQSLEIMELTLGLIVVKGKSRFCLTNGVMLAEGAAGNGFLVHRIEENRVWYKVAEALLYLRPGDKVNVDAEGNIREIPDETQAMEAEDSDLKLNETQVNE
jgi:hypothetical protein